MDIGSVGERGESRRRRDIALIEGLNGKKKLFMEFVSDFLDCTRRERCVFSLSAIDNQISW